MQHHLGEIIFTIGHTTRTLPEFVTLPQDVDVTLLGESEGRPIAPPWNVGFGNQGQQQGDEQQEHPEPVPSGGSQWEACRSASWRGLGLDGSISVARAGPPSEPSGKH